MVNEQVTTIELTAGTPSTVEFSGAYPYYWIDNKSDSDVYASLGTPEAGADGTYTIAAGSQLRISGGAFNTKLSLLGSGKVQVIASSIASCPFKMPRKGGDSGGGDVGGKIDYTKMPYNTGLSNAFTAHKSTITPTAWKNDIGDTDFILQNAILSDNAMTMYNKSVGYLPISEPDEWTAYVLCKTDVVETVKYTNMPVFGTYDALFEVRIHSSTKGLLVFNGNTSNISLLEAYSLITIRKNSDAISIFVNGNLLKTITGTFTSSGDKFMIKCREDNGVTPTESDYNLTVQLKCCVICDTTHGDTAIAANSDWILSKFNKSTTEE